MERWRDVSRAERERFVEHMSGQMLERYETGRRVHGEVFEGSPIDHAVEEAIDLLYYLEMSRRELDELKRGNQDARRAYA